ncbi:hypothetical protein NPIL_564081 [Nephila pilipes]|uniref:Uncharacterized protein n=1 Tax=Nephila pilipes TaxID=299642 RepID=A0A8X6U685_NEPPI|nr:hypothetical protein NPIL_564081 [Nephila pilipes]
MEPVMRGNYRIEQTFSIVQSDLTDENGLFAPIVLVGDLRVTERESDGLRLDGRPRDFRRPFRGGRKQHKRATKKTPYLSDAPKEDEDERYSLEAGEANVRMVREAQ